MADKIVMGYWDCPSCGSKGIPGTTYDCPNCGRQRGKETKFYMKSGPVEYVAGHKVVGADWYCEYCGALNSAGKTVCENCGSPKSESKDDYFSLKNPPKPKQPEPSVHKATAPSFDPLSIIHKVKQSSLAIKLIAGIILLIIVSNLISSFISKPRDYAYDVKELTWENSIEIEEYKTFRESDWYLPNGARLVDTNWEIRTYESVLDHYETVTRSRQVPDGGHYETSYSDNGDGTFTEESTYVTDYTTEYYEEDEPVYRQEPVYDTKYYYDIDRWVYERTETTTGKDKNPYWADITLNDKERESGRDSKYTMTGIRHYRSFFKDRTKEETYEIQESWWKQIQNGQTLNITVEKGRVTAWQ
jgi:hypothetical protein